MTRNVDLTNEQQKAYKQMKEYALAMLDAERAFYHIKRVDADMRLQEICCGHLRTDDGDIQALDSNRMSEMLNVVDEMMGKVIIWASYVWDIRRIADALATQYGHDSSDVFYGQTAQDDRDRDC